MANILYEDIFTSPLLAEPKRKRKEKTSEDTFTSEKVNAYIEREKYISGLETRIAELEGNLNEAMNFAMERTAKDAVISTQAAEIAEYYSLTQTLVQRTEAQSAEIERLQAALAAKAKQEEREQ